MQSCCCTGTQELGDYLETYRGTANNLSVTFEQNIEFYTAVNFALMSWSQSVVVVPHHATLRRRVPRPEFDMDPFWPNPIQPGCSQPTYNPVHIWNS